MFTQVELNSLIASQCTQEQVDCFGFMHTQCTIHCYSVTAFPSLPLNVCVPLQQALITLV